MGRRNAGRALLPGDGRQRRDDHAAHALCLAAAGDDGGRAVAGAAAAGAENDVHTLGLQLPGDLRAGLFLEFLDVAAAAHKGIGLVCQRADKALLHQLVEPVDGEHGVDVLVDIGVVKAAVGHHQLAGRGGKLDGSV